MVGLWFLAWGFVVRPRVRKPQTNDKNHGHTTSQAESNRNEPSRAEQSRAEQSRAEQSRAEQTEPGQSEPHAPHHAKAGEFNIIIFQRFLLFLAVVNASASPITPVDPVGKGLR